MKRALISLALFFAVQVLAAITAAGYMFCMGKGAGTDSDEFALVAGVALLIGNFALAVTLYFSAKKRSLIKKAELLHGSTIAAVSLLLLALGETLGLAPLGLDDPDTERLFTVMAASPLCLLNLCIVGPVAEEFVFRWGVLGGLLQRGTKPWVAILVSTLCFAAVHGNLMQAPPALVSGVLLGIIYLRTQSLVPCIIAHIFNNTLAVLSMAHPDFEDTLTAQPTLLLVTEGILLAAMAFTFAFRIKKDEDRND